jgi:2Fe-2S ferredoxin
MISMNSKEVHMPRLKVVRHSGEEVEIKSTGGTSVMVVMRDNGIDEVLAMCGGSRACATCHVYVDPAFSDRLPAIGDDENELLDGSRHRQPNSRLSCQLAFDDSLDGLEVTVAPHD